MTLQTPGAGLALIQRPREVEASLWRRLRFEHDQYCRTALFERHARLARLIAKSEVRRRPSYGLDRSDFEQLAYSGLLEAIDKFDPLRGAPFEAFARHRIRGSIADGVAHSSEGAAQYAHRHRVERERMESISHGRTTEGSPLKEFSDLAIALALGLVAEGAAETPGAEAYKTHSWRDLQLSVLSEIDRLPDKERVVLQQHYMNGVAFVQIAALLGLTKGRISQIHAAALRRVRARLRQVD